jgi:hypothetical protein
MADGGLPEVVERCRAHGDDGPAQLSIFDGGHDTQMTSRIGQGEQLQRMPMTGSVSGWTGGGCCTGDCAPASKLWGCEADHSAGRLVLVNRQRCEPLQMESDMVCRIDTLEGAVLVSHTPTIAVFTTTAEHLDSIPRKSDGHYNRDDVMTLVTARKAVMYDASAVRAIARASEFVIFGCPPG